MRLIKFQSPRKIMARIELILERASFFPPSPSLLFNTAVSRESNLSTKNLISRLDSITDKRKLSQAEAPPRTRLPATITEISRYPVKTGVFPPLYTWYRSLQSSMAIILIRFNTEKNEGMEIKIFRDIRIGKISRYAWTLEWKISKVLEFCSN